MCLCMSVLRTKIQGSCLTVTFEKEDIYNNHTMIFLVFVEKGILNIDISGKVSWLRMLIWISIKILLLLVAHSH